MNKDQRNALQNARRKKNIDGWRALGINDADIKRLDLRNKNPEKKTPQQKAQIKKEGASYRRTKTRKANIKKRTATLKKKGITPTPQNTKNDKAMLEALGYSTDPNKVYHAKYYLALCFTSVYGGEAMFTTAKYKNWGFWQIVKAIKKRLKTSEDNPEGYNNTINIFQFFVGDKSECAQQLSAFEDRGYNLSIGKLLSNKYIPLFNRNDWTMREFAELVLCVLEQCHNKDALMYYHELQNYTEMAGLPFGDIFN